MATPLQRLCQEIAIPYPNQSSGLFGISGHSNFLDFLVSGNFGVASFIVHPEYSEQTETAFQLVLFHVCSCTFMYLENTRSYSPLCGLTSSSCGGLWPSAKAFFALRAKKELIMLFWPIFGNFGVQ